MKEIELVATDLDGTFLRNDRTISERNMDALHRLGEKRIIRVAATGRNLRKVKEVLNEDVPFDYIVFSSGAGVYDWKNNRHVYDQNIKKEAAEELSNWFIKRGISFHAFFPVPENHKHWYFRGSENCEEFERYFKFNHAHAISIKESGMPDTALCQFLIIIPEEKNRFEKLKEEIEELSKAVRVIRTSSPITKGYIWIEIFHNKVSKGNGVKFLCDSLGIAYENTAGIGNDYNDFDLLEFTRYSFLTQNAPDEIKNFYFNMPSNEEDAFAHMLNPIFTEKM